VLHSLLEGKYLDEAYLFHVQLSSRRTLLVSSEHVFLLSAGRYYVIDWKTSFKSVSPPIIPSYITYLQRQKSCGSSGRL
jgi:hypothetical protein